MLVKVLQRNRTCDIYIRACCHFSRVQILSTLWTVTCQALLSMAFFRQEYWSVWLCPPPEGLLDPGIKPTSLMSPELAGRFFTISAIWEAPSTSVSVTICTIKRSVSRNQAIMENDKGHVSRLETFRQELMLQTWERISLPSKQKSNSVFAYSDFQPIGWSPLTLSNQMHGPEQTKYSSQMKWGSILSFPVEPFLLQSWKKSAVRTGLLFPSPTPISTEGKWKSWDGAMSELRSTNF